MLKLDILDFGCSETQNWECVCVCVRVRDCFFICVVYETRPHRWLATMTTRASRARHPRPLFA